MDLNYVFAGLDKSTLYRLRSMVLLDPKPETLSVQGYLAHNKYPPP